MRLRICSPWNRSTGETVLLAVLRLTVERAPMSNRYGTGRLNMWRPADEEKFSFNAGQPSGVEAMAPELSLALAVVCAAIVDIHRGSRRRFVRESDAGYAIRKQEARDAEDFLLHRLNEDDNCWGRVLRQCGMKPLTPERVAYLVRNRAFLTLEQFAAA
jgi:hypothetical protein